MAVTVKVSSSIKALRDEGGSATDRIGTELEATIEFLVCVRGQFQAANMKIENLKNLDFSSLTQWRRRQSTPRTPSP
jgi:hypothetical protein